MHAFLVLITLQYSHVCPSRGHPYSHGCKLTTGSLHCSHHIDSYPKALVVEVPNNFILILTGEVSGLLIRANIRRSFSNLSK